MHCHFSVFTVVSHSANSGNHTHKGFSFRFDFQCHVNIYTRTCVKFSFANKIEAIHEGSLIVSVKVEPRSNSCLSSAFFILPLFYLRV